MSNFLTSIWSNLALIGKIIGNERGEVGEHEAAAGDAGEGADAGGDAGADDKGAAGDAAGDADGGDGGEAKAVPKPDWRVDKYGDGWEDSAQYWKDNSAYAWSQYKTEKGKRQKSVPLEDFQADTDKAKPAAAAKENGAGKSVADLDADSDIQTVQELLQHVNKQNEQFFESKLSERENQANFKNSMQKARRESVGDPDNGIPSFADLEQEVLIPLVESNPRVLTLLKEMPGDPGDNAYTLAILVKAKNMAGLRGMFEKKGREDFAKKLDDVSKQAVRLKAGRSVPTSVKTTPEDIWGMSSADFEKHVAKQTGRAY